MRWSNSMRAIVVMIVSLVVAIPAWGQFDTTYYSEFRVGDTLPPTVSLPAYPVLVCFASESSCSICMESLGNMQRYIERSDCGSMVLFLATAKAKLIDQLKSEQGWRFPIEKDAYGAIHAGFGVKHTPFYYLISRHGVILAMGPIGSVSDDFETTLKELNNECTKMNSSQMDSLIIENEKLVTCDDNRFFPSLQHQAILLDSGTKALIVLLPSQDLIVVDSKGECRKTVKYSSLFNHRTSGILLGTGRSDSRSFVIGEIPDTDHTMKYFQFSSDLTILDSALLSAPENPLRYWIFNGWQSTQRRIFTTLKPSDDKYSADMPTFSMYSVSDGNSVSAGSPVEHFLNYNLQGYYWQTYAFRNNGNVLTLQNLSEEVVEYDSLGVEVSRSKINNDTTVWKVAWRTIARKRSDTTTIEFQKGLQNVTSTMHTVLYDEVTDKIYSSFSNSSTLGGTTTFYITGPIGEASQRTVMVPKSGIPFGIRSGDIYCTTIRDDGLSLMRCKF